MKSIRLILSLLLCALAAAPSALAEGTLALSLYDGAMVVDEDGREVIPRGKYAGIYVIQDDPARYAVSAETGGAAAMADEAGEAITDYIYDYLYAIEGGICCMQGDKMGVLAEDGTEKVPCEYTYLTANGQGGYLALRTDPYDETPDGVYKIDASGEVTATGVRALRMYSAMQEGLLPAMSAENELYGYLDGDGVWAIAPQYDFAGDFAGGVAQASISTGAGVISPSGNWLLTPQYEYVDTPSDPGKYRAAYTGSGVALIDADTWQTAKVYEGGSSYSSGGYIVITAPEECVLYGPEGDVRFRTDGDCLISAWEIQGDCAVIAQGEWGEEIYWLCDMQGNRISPSYQWISSLENGLYAVAEFEVETTEYDQGALVLNEEVPGTMRTGCMDTQGNLIVPMEYEILFAASENRLWMEKDGVGYLTDLKGEVIARYDLS